MSTSEEIVIYPNLKKKSYLKEMMKIVYGKSQYYSKMANAMASMTFESSKALSLLEHALSQSVFCPMDHSFMI